jgi:hypothetical protein
MKNFFVKFSNLSQILYEMKLNSVTNMMTIDYATFTETFQVPPLNI